MTSNKHASANHAGSYETPPPTFEKAQGAQVGSMVGHIFGKHPMTANGVLFNFLFLAMMFAINHGTVTTFISIGSANMGRSLSGYFNATLYITYVLVALTLSSVIVEFLKPKKALAAAMIIYMFYILGYVIVDTANMSPANADAVAIVCTSIAGISAGFLWTAQGAFFTRSAQAYSKLTGTSLPTVTRRMGGAFSACLLLVETIAKFAVSPILRSGVAFGYLAAIYSIIGFAAGVGTLLVVRDVPDDSSVVARKPLTALGFLRKTLLAVELMYTSGRLWLIIPMQIAFGFSAAYMNNYINGASVAGAAVSKNNIGYVQAATPATAALLSVVIGYISPRTGNGPLLVIGCLCYAAIPLVVLVTPLSSIVNLGYGIIVLYCVQGVGRVIFESTNKAMMAEFYPNDTEAIFSNAIIWSGTASTIGYFVFPHASGNTISYVTLITGFVAAVSMTVLFSTKQCNGHTSHEEDDEETDSERKRLIPL